jgi:hypothetical protein
MQRRRRRVSQSRDRHLPGLLTLRANIVSFTQLREVNAHHNSWCVHLVASSLPDVPREWAGDNLVSGDATPKWEVFGMSIRRTLIAVLALAIAIAFSPLSQLQAATVSPGANPGVDNAVVKVAKKAA